MSLTAATYAEKVFYRVSQGNPEADAGIYRTAIVATMSDAITETCIASLDTDWRADLEHDYTLTITAGVASFAAATDLLPQSIIPCNRITHSSITGPGTALLPLRIVDSTLEMRLQAVPDATFGCAYVGATAVESFYRGAVLTGSLIVRAIQIPAITAWPVALEPQLIEVGAQLAIAKVRGITGNGLQ